MDTRLGSGKAGAFGAPTFGGGSSRTLPVPSGGCGLPSTAKAYALNITLVPVNISPIDQITLWPTGWPRPFVNTVVDPRGRILANNAVVPAGTGGSVDIYSSGNTDMIVDVNGYFIEGGTSLFYPVTSCRVVDTRPAYAPPDIGPAFGGPIMSAGEVRQFPIPSGRCGIPYGAQAYDMNITVSPQGFLGYLTIFPSGTAQPFVSTLNSLDGRVLANGAIVQAGASGAVDVYVTDATDVIIDIAGYFAPDDGTGRGLPFNTIYPCRTHDLTLSASATLPLTLRGTCGIPQTASAYAANFTVTPTQFFGFLAAWPTGGQWLGVSLLNAFDGWGVGNAAIVPGGGDGGISMFATDPGRVMVDVTGHFSRPAGKKILKRASDVQDAYTLTNNIWRESTYYHYNCPQAPNTGTCTPVSVRNFISCSMVNSSGNVYAEFRGNDPQTSYGTILAFRADPNAQTGPRDFTCINSEPAGNVSYLGSVNVYNATPVLAGISPASIPAGEATLVTFYGSGFGTTLPALIFAGGIVSASLVPGSNSDTQFQAYITAPVGSYDVTVRSSGNGNGFQQGGGTQPTSTTPRRLDALLAGFGISVSVNGSAISEGQTVFLSTGDPQLNISATVAGNITGQVFWSINAVYADPLEWIDPNNQLLGKTERSASYGNISLQPSQTFTYAVSTGEEVAVSARLSSNQTLQRIFHVRGTNPTAAQILAELSSDPRWYWPNILFAESGPQWRYFNAGLPILGPPHGFGALQVELNPRTQGATPADQLAKMFNWKLNVAAAKALNAGKAVEAQTFYWDQYIQWLGFVLDNNGAPTIPGPYSEFTVSSPSQCTFVDPSDVSGVPGSRSYIDAMTIKKYNGGVSYLRWVNDPLRGIGWAAAPTAFASVPAPPKCQKYVKRACTLSSVDTILPLIDGGCDKPYNYEWVSTFLLP